MDFYRQDKEAVMNNYVPSKKTGAPRNTVYCVCADRSFVRELPEGRPPLAWFLGNTMKGSYVGHGNYNRAVQHMYESNLCEILVILNNASFLALDEKLFGLSSLN